MIKNLNPATLIELLFVMDIIAVFTAILFPALTIATHKTRETICVNKQLK